MLDLLVLAKRYNIAVCIFQSSKVFQRVHTVRCKIAGRWDWGTAASKIADANYTLGNFYDGRLVSGTETWVGILNASSVFVDKARFLST